MTQNAQKHDQIFLFLFLKEVLLTKIDRNIAKKTSCQCDGFSKHTSYVMKCTGQKTTWYRLVTVTKCDQVILFVVYRYKFK